MFFARVHERPDGFRRRSLTRVPQTRVNLVCV